MTMVKFCLGVLIGLVSSVALAKAPRLSCTLGSEVTLEDTSYIFTELEDSYHLRVRYSPGATPIEPDPSTTVRVRDLKGLSERAQLFSKVPQKFDLYFPKKQCSFRNSNSQFSWHCYLGQAGNLKHLKYEDLSFFVFSQKIESFDETYHRYNVGLEFKMSLDDLYGTKELEEIIAASTGDQRSDLEFRRKYEKVLRSMIVGFNNLAGASPCQVPEHPFQGVLEQI